MSDNFDKEIEEIIRIVNIDHTKPAANKPQPYSPQGTSRHSQRGKASQHSPCENERPRRIAKRRKQRVIRGKWIIIGCVFAVLVLIIVLICKGCTGGKDTDTDLVGIWHYDQYTEYEFDSNGNGCMCLDGDNHYEFTYKTEGDTLYLDFALDYVTDCQYTYTVDGDKLTLVGGEGTAELGKVYELTKE